jgi:hypothetical protein
MFERARRWLCAGAANLNFGLVCNHCQHTQQINARELTVQVTNYQAKTYLAGQCVACRKVMAKEITIEMGDAALNGGARFVHLVENPPISEKDIRKFRRSVDEELAKLLT